MAARNNQVACLRVLHRVGADMCQKNNAGACPVFVAAMHNHMDTLRFLVTELALPVEVTDNDGATPVWAVASQGHLECLKFLLDGGADPSTASPCSDARVSRVSIQPNATCP